MKTAITVLIAAMAFSGLALPASVNALNECHRLYLYMPPTTNYYFSYAFCGNGVLLESTPDMVIVGQSSLEGPLCTIEVAAYGRTRDQFHSKFDVHQDFCFLKAGDITVSHQGGSRPVYTITKGSWSDNREGKIQVTV